MTKRERIEDLGVLKIKLLEILDYEIFHHTDFKHGFDEWVKQNHDKKEYDEPRGLDGIFRDIRGLRYAIEECFGIALGDDE